jgi:dipeptidyl aminopeptidase/acylaminoacyl peptidase
MPTRGFHSILRSRVRACDEALPTLFLLGCLVLGLASGCSQSTLPEQPILPFDESPVWSPDGRWIAFRHVSGSPNDSLPTGLYVLDLATHSRTRVVNAWPTTMAWFSDSRRLAFSAAEILVVDVETRDVSALFPVGGWYLNVSPADTTLAFDTTYNDPKGSHMIWLGDLSTGELRDISVHGTGEWRQPRWSPDGRWILHYRYGLSSNGTPELVKMDPTGKSAVRLTTDTAWDFDACWSPDGSQIAWTRNYKEVWLMSGDGTNARYLHRGCQPWFSPDGLSIVFVDPDVSSNSLRRINVDGTGYAPL